MAKKDKKLVLKGEFIKDYFYLQGEKIAVLETKAFKKLDENILVLAKVIETKDERTLKPLTDEEYDEAIKKYDALVKLINEEDEANG